MKKVVMSTTISDEMKMKIEKRILEIEEAIGN